MPSQQRATQIGRDVAGLCHRDKTHERQHAQMPRAGLLRSEVLPAQEPQAHDAGQRQPNERDREGPGSQSLDRGSVGTVGGDLHDEQRDDREDDRDRRPAHRSRRRRRGRGRGKGLGAGCGREHHRHHGRSQQPRRQSDLSRREEPNDFGDTSDREHNRNWQQPPGGQRAAEADRVCPGERREGGCDQAREDGARPEGANHSTPRLAGLWRRRVPRRCMRSGWMPRRCSFGGHG